MANVSYIKMMTMQKQDELGLNIAGVAFEDNNGRFIGYIQHELGTSFFPTFVSHYFNGITDAMKYENGPGFKNHNAAEFWLLSMAIG